MPQILPWLSAALQANFAWLYTRAIGDTWVPTEVLDQNGFPLLPCSAAKADGPAGSRSSRSRRRAAWGNDTLKCDVAVRFMRGDDRIATRRTPTSR
jgi:hypothetical protein